MENSEISTIKHLINTCEYNSAQIILEKKFKKDPNNVEIIDLLSEVYFNQDNIEGAKKLIKKSINLSPNTNPEKYMLLGQLLNNPEDSVKFYNKAITLLKEQLKNNVEDNNEIRESIASGLASIASLYMTTNLCEKNNAEEICENCIKEGLIISHNNIDILLQMSNLRILRKRDKEAKEILDKIMNLININDVTNDNFPDHDILLNIANNYAEINCYAEAIKLLSILVKIDDEDLNCWYLMAFDNYLCGNYKEAYELVEKIFHIYNNNPNHFSDFQDVISASEELKNNLEQRQQPLKNKHEEILNYNDNKSSDDEEMQD
jgi:tetratricopeptide (TPR) repeat protein